jgi:2-polyprenyl-6-methoxyphenol hydroxylase-like FAD-dependent oxidoreductase
MTGTTSGRPAAGPAGHEVDVLVVGGGPAGMTVAGDLARLGRSVTVLEKWPSINPSSRAFATMARTLEVLDARGLAEELLASSATTPTVHLFAGATLDLGHLPSRYPFVMIAPQTDVDQALGRYAVAQGAEVRRGIEVTGLVQDAAGVTVTARPKGDDDPGHSTTWRAGYVVGTDGAHSTVRRLVGVDFPGRSVLSSVVLADVKLADGPQGGGLTLGSTPEEFGFLVPYGRADDDGAWYRSMTWDRHHQVADTEPVGAAEVTRVLDRAMGRDVGVVEVGWHSRFHCDERQAPQYRVGRVFLAGDAAHVHSPMGGQGMNTGIQDGANLAWKLDAVLGGAPDAVLDTYHAERHPIGERVLWQSGLMMRGVTLHPTPARAVRDLLAPRLLAVPRVRDAIAGSFAGTGLRYPAGPGRDSLVGTRATEVPLDGCRLTELQRRPGFVLVVERDAPSGRGLDVRQLLHTRRTDGGPALLVRPDGYIAWAGASATRTGPDGWQTVLAGWTGTGPGSAVDLTASR